MYESATTWNPFKGCKFDCVYCIPSFQRQAKRQKNNCMKCYSYTPHFHEERLPSIPNSEIVFVCGNSDISFASEDQMILVIDAIKKNNLTSRRKKIFYLQTKQPSCLKPYLKMLPENVILLTTLETNRDAGYEKVSKAPVPSERFKQFKELDYPRKVVTCEPALDFDVDVFSKWIMGIKPEYIWLGYDSKNCGLIEPPIEKMRELTEILSKNGILVRGKDLRDYRLHKSKGSRNRVGLT